MAATRLFVPHEAHRHRNELTDLLCQKESLEAIKVIALNVSSQEKAVSLRSQLSFRA